MYNGIVDGEIAQLARAFGSYPTGRWFESTSRYQKNTHFTVCFFIYGGDGGSRTLVQYSIHTNFYKFSLLFDFQKTTANKHAISFCSLLNTHYFQGKK